MENGIMKTMEQDMQLPETGPRTAETIGSEIRYLSHQAKCMTVWFGVEIGKRLSEAKAMVGHGGWLDFLKKETEFSQSSANRFIDWGMDSPVGKGAGGIGGQEG